MTPRGIYRLSEDERAAVRKGVAAAERGEFVPDDEMEAFYNQVVAVDRE